MPFARLCSSIRLVRSIAFWCLCMSASVAGLKLSSPTNMARHPARDSARDTSGSEMALNVIWEPHTTSSGSSAALSSFAWRRLPPRLLSRKVTTFRWYQGTRPRSMRWPSRMSRTTSSGGRTW
jgi:hypothetical protein